MKKLLLILTVCLAFGCKKKDSEANVEITNYNWILQSAVVSPALQIDGKAETNFMTMAGPSGCLNSNYTLNFANNGAFAITSTGPLCDMISFQNAKWTKTGSEIKMDDGFGHISIYTLDGQKITNKYVFDQNNTTYTVTYVFTAKSK
jgi:hypothetical protein